VQTFNELSFDKIVAAKNSVRPSEGTARGLVTYNSTFKKPPAPRQRFLIIRL